MCQLLSRLSINLVRHFQTDDCSLQKGSVQHCHCSEVPLICLFSSVKKEGFITSNCFILRISPAIFLSN